MAPNFVTRPASNAVWKREKMRNAHISEMRNKPLTQYKTTTYKQPTNTKNPSLLYRDLYRVSQNYHDPDSSAVAHPALNDGNASYFGETRPSSWE